MAAPADDSSMVPHASLEQAFRLCSSGGDEERFVGLVLAARAAPHAEQPVDFVRRIIDQVGLAYLERMLRTAPADTPGPSHALRPLSLRLLALALSEPGFAVPRAAEIAALAATSLGTEDEEEAENARAVACALAHAPHVAEAVLRDTTAVEHVAGLVTAGTNGGGARRALALLAALACAAQRPVSLTGGATAGAQRVTCALAAAADSASPGDEARFSTLATLTVWLDAFAEHLAPAAAREWHASVRRALAQVLGSRLPRARRMEALQLGALMLEHFGGGWALGADASAWLRRADAPAPAAEPTDAAHHHASGTGTARRPTADAPGARAAERASFAHLFVQLAGVELAMLLHAQPARLEPLAPEQLRTLLACCTALECALSEMNADASDDDEAVGQSGAAGNAGARAGSEDSWATALDDASLLGMHRAVLGAVEACAQFAEDAADLSPPHELLPVAARLMCAWLAQPSAALAESTEERVRALAPKLCASLRDLAPELAHAPWLSVLH